MPPTDVTGLLQKWTAGDRSAIDQLTPLIYAELRKLAHRYLRRERPGHTLQSTALVHEAWLRLIDQKQAKWRDRAHFFAVSGQMMRRILVDHARAQQREKRGGRAQLLVLDVRIDDEGIARRQQFRIVVDHLLGVEQGFRSPVIPAPMQKPREAVAEIEPLEKFDFNLRASPSGG